MNREEAIEWLNDIKELEIEALSDWCYDVAIDMAIEALKAEPKTGAWDDVENEPYCECSVCGAYIDNLDDDYSFCPRCGAKMDKE